MEFSLFPAWIAGLVGAIVMTAMMKGAAKAGMTTMPGMALIQGAMVTDDPDKARKIGMFTHLVVMGTIVFGTIYAVLFATLGTASWLVGGVIGLVHGLIAGGIGLPMMGNMHPRMEGAAAFTGQTTWESNPGTLRIAEPGLFGVNYGAKTGVGLVVGHIVFGAVVALVYGALV